MSGYAMLVLTAYQWGRYPNESPLVPAGLQAPTVFALTIFVAVTFALSHRNHATQEQHRAMERWGMPFLGGVVLSGFGLLGALHAGMAVWLHTDGPGTRFGEIPVVIAVFSAVGSAFLLWLRWNDRRRHQDGSHSHSPVLMSVTTRMSDARRRP